MESELVKNSKVENELATLCGDLEDLPTNMRFFSLALRSLYAEKAVSADTDVAKKFNKLRDDTRKDAMIYVKVILPVSTEVVRSLNEFFEYYGELDYDDWCDNLENIIEDVKSYKSCCKEVVKLHEDIMVPLKKREDEAKIITKEFEQLSALYERQKEDIEYYEHANYVWGWALSWVPVVNLIATPILLSKSNVNTAEVIAKGAQLEVNEAAIFTVSEVMVPALKHFIDGLNAAAGFFSIIENELNSIQGKAEKGAESPKKLHYTMMKNKANDIKGYCQGFYAMIPQVRTDFEAINFEIGDKNYVDEWLVKKKKEINEKYRSNLKGSLKKMVQLMTGHH